VERQVGKSAAAMLLQGRTGQTFNAIVTGASDKGTWARIAAPPVEGKIVRNERGLKVGQQVRVRLARADVARGFIDFVRI
jgi:exoribonuclease II